MESRSRKVTNIYSGVAAVAAFVTQPIPLLDELIVVPVQYSFVFGMAKARKVSALKLPWGVLQKIIWYGAGARLLGNFSLGLVPFVGMFSNAITAAALTEYLGRYLDHVLDDPNAPPPEVGFAQLRHLFAAALTKKGTKQGAEANPETHGTPNAEEAR